MEYFDIELIYQYLKDNYPNIDELKLIRTNEFHHRKYINFTMDTITIFYEKYDFEELWCEDFNNHEEVFQKINEITITKNTIYREYFLAKQRNDRIVEILSE